MMKHIIGCAVYQIIVIYTIVFAGEYWFPEPNKKYVNPANGKYVYPGRPYNWDQTPLYEAMYPEWGPSRHFTVVFNVFVWL
jgi:hypothetical protein